GIDQEKVRDPKPEDIDKHFMKTLGTSGRLVEHRFLGAGQISVAVLDCPRNDGQAVRLELRKTDDDVGFQNYTGDTHHRHEIGIEIDLERIGPYVAIVTPGRFHEPRFYKALLVIAVIEKPGILAHDQGSRGQRFDFINYRAEHRRMGDNTFLYLR